MKYLSTYEERQKPTTGRWWDEKNDFSTYHYHLGKGYYMYDIDGFFIDENNNVKYIIEDKIKYNFKKVHQKDSLNIFARSIGSILLLEETSTDSWWIVDYKNDIHPFNKSLLPRYKKVESCNRIYIEVRSAKKTKAVMCLTDNFHDYGDLTPILKALKRIYPLFYVKIYGKYKYDFYNTRAYSKEKVRTLEEWKNYYNQVGLKNNTRYEEF